MKRLLAVLVAALLIPSVAIAVPPHERPDLSVTVSGTTFTVEGENFTPSSGGQHVILWVGYPDDYCDYPGPCHGFYAYPHVADDGTFIATYADIPGTGTGIVIARHYLPKPDKWRTVASVEYIL